jgi:pseudouridine-5'-monophosphatase
MTWDIKAGCMGLRKLLNSYLICTDANASAAEEASAKHLLSFFPDIPLTLESCLAQKNEMLDKLWPTVSVLPGVRKLVHHLKAHNIPIAVATSSRRHKYELKITNLGDLFSQFEGKVVCSDDKQFNMRGKPNPDIFITAAREMLGRNVGHPEECTTDHLQERARGLVFEDALPGVQAGKRADMSGSFVFLNRKQVKCS